MGLRFVDLFAGLGGFHVALRRLGHEWVYACEIDDELREVYAQNFSGTAERLHGDIRDRGNKDAVPGHDILCAGFPCQPFSKSGQQQGLGDPTRGTLFHEIAEVLRRHRPQYLILENVGNFERHDGGRTWRIVRHTLEELGYAIRGTEHVRSGGGGLLSPHHLGFPHSRERFFIVGRMGTLPTDPFPPRKQELSTNLSTIAQPADELSERDRQETRLSEQQVACVDHWNSLLASLPQDAPLPSFPVWGDEFGATYPYQAHSPHAASEDELRSCLDGRAEGGELSKADLLLLLPNYARTPEERFPVWKQQFIRQNREWFAKNHSHVPGGWLDRLRQFPPSLRKLEWNCQGEERDLWRHVLQFRPSGLRVKRYSTAPSLVAMTDTQIPILGPERRFITRTEGLLLQGFGKDHRLPRARNAAFRALGNAVHVDVVEAIARRLVSDAGHGGQQPVAQGTLWPTEAHVDFP